MPTLDLGNRSIHEELIARPPAIELANPEAILSGPPVDPLDRVRIYSAEEFEQFIQEWAYFYLQEMAGTYVRVTRLGGSGDKGRDILGYFPLDAGSEGCDTYQCKHYNYPLRPDDVWLELGKLCYFTHDKLIPLPRQFRFVAPFDAGPELARLLDVPDELKAKLIEKWPSKCETKIQQRSRISLSGDLLRYVQEFDFSIVKVKPILEVIAEHGRTIMRAPRFGGGLNKPPPPDPVPPESIEGHETRYVAQLLAAYADKLLRPGVEMAELARHPELRSHFERSRQRYYCAEALRLFARDNLPENVTFRQVQDQVLDAVIDVHELAYANGYERLVKTTTTASQVSITNHILRSYLTSQNRQGICHQLANDDLLTWVR